MDKITPAARSQNMKRIKSKGTKPEVLVRRIVHGLGLRYRLHRKDLPGKPDLVFAGQKKVIFVHGCYWHQHSGCREGRLPGSNIEYWGPKLTRNVERDQQNQKSLKEAGWHILTVWECETTNIKNLTERLETFLQKPKRPGRQEQKCSQKVN